MTIVETAVFSRQIDRPLDRESYRRLQLELADDPKRGPVIPRSGGLRKIRWEGSGRGKRGGIRVIYWVAREDLLLMLLAYPKNVQDDLTQDQLRALRQIVERELT